jgi:hypothetical protein
VPTIRTKVPAGLGLSESRCIRAPPAERRSQPIDWRLAAAYLRLNPRCGSAVLNPAGPSFAQMSASRAQRNELSRNTRQVDISYRNCGDPGTIARGTGSGAFGVDSYGRCVPARWTFGNASAGLCRRLACQAMSEQLSNVDAQAGFGLAEGGQAAT